MPGTASRSGGDHTSARGSDPFPVDGLPTMPTDISEAEKTVWNDLLGRIPSTVFRSVDGVAQFRILCECIVMARNQYSRLRRDPMDRDAHRMYMQTIAHIHKLSPQFGLAPGDRTKMKIIEQIEDDAEAWMKEE